MVKEKLSQKENKSTNKNNNKFLILHNDDFNHFEFVVQALIEICGHSAEQAEQCTLIAHFKGRCEIERGAYDNLIVYHKLLTSRNLTTTIE